MNRTNVVRVAQSASPAPASGLSSPGGPSLRLKQIQDYQIMARVRLKERLSGSPTTATLYDLLMRDQLTAIKRQSHA